MKRHLIIFLLLNLIGFGYIYFQYHKNNSVPSEIKGDPKNFVSLKNQQFYLKGERFFPIALNFVVSLCTNDTAMWPAVYVSYLPQEKWETDRISSLEELKATMQLIKDMGFNTVRLTHIGEPEVSNVGGGRISFKASKGNNHNYQVYLENEENYERYLKAIDDLMEAVGDAELKAIFTVRMVHELPRTEDHLKRLCLRFRENPTLVAYDFFNEPLYFDSIKHSKSEVYQNTKIWQRIVKTYAPLQLSTIGLACQRELFSWDPNLVNVDFLSMHPYDYEPDQVRNELYWYNKYIKKPWIIGETGIPSNNDSIPYANQSKFARKVFNQLVNCNGQGFSWWQYKDLDWGYYHQNYLGVVNRHGQTLNSKNQWVQGTPKPVTSEIKTFLPLPEKRECFCPENYYNFSSNKEFRIIGKLIDENGNAIGGGGILAWDEWWINHYFTTSRPDGTFQLFSNYSFYHWMVSSTLNEMIRGDINPKNAISVNGIPTIDVGTIQLKKVLLN